MPEPLVLVLTDIGYQRLAEAQSGGALDLTIATLGLTNQAFVATRALTALPGEFRRVADVSGAPVGDNIVHLLMRDSAAIAYQARGFGLFLADGSLFASYGQADTLFEKSAAATFHCAIDFAFESADVDAITFGATNFLNPPATTATAGVAAIATQAIVDTGADNSRIVTPNTLRVRLLDLASSLLASFGDALADYVPLAQKAQAGGVATLDGAGLLPLAQLPIAAGTITLFYGAAAPAGWAICNGQTIGAFVTPDLRGRVAVGVSADHALGSAFGAGSVTLDTDTATSGVQLNYSVYTTYAGGGTQHAVAAGAQGTPPSLTDNAHSHSVTVDVTQPSLALNYIIKL